MIAQLTNSTSGPYKWVIVTVMEPAIGIPDVQVAVGKEGLSVAFCASSSPAAAAGRRGKLLE